MKLGAFQSTVQSDDAVKILSGVVRLERRISETATFSLPWSVQYHGVRRSHGALRGSSRTMLTGRLTGVGAEVRAAAVGRAASGAALRPGMGTFLPRSDKFEQFFFEDVEVPRFSSSTELWTVLLCRGSANCAEDRGYIPGAVRGQGC